MFDPNNLDLMTDEERAAAFAPLLKLNALPGQRAELERQMMQAQALSHPQPANFGSVGGNIAGGIGNVLQGIAGGLQSRHITQQLNDNSKAMQDPAVFNSPLMRQLLMSQMLGTKQQQQPGQVSAAGMGDLAGAYNGAA